jgi:hypothetical protein
MEANTVAIHRSRGHGLKKFSASFLLLTDILHFLPPGSLIALLPSSTSSGYRTLLSVSHVQPFS